MPHEDSVTKIKLCYTLWKNGVSLETLPAQLGVHRSTVYRWIKGIKKKGIRKFIRDYEHAKRGRKRPRRTHGMVKQRIYRIRKEYRGCCGEKIRYILLRDYGESPSVATIYRILGEQFVLRSKWKKYSKRGFVRRGNSPREVIQTDTVDLGSIYAFTAIDTFTREASVIIRPRLTSSDGKQALKQQLEQFGTIAHIQRDGGSEFKGRWQEHAQKHIPSIRTARPYKKNEQAFIESFNRTLRKECLGHGHYRKKDLNRVQHAVNTFLHYYHTKRPHLSLHMQTPKEFAAAHAAGMSHLT